MNDFPTRVTLFDDGAYRWAYDLDMRHNRYILNLILKLLGLLLGLPTLFILAMVLLRAVPLMNSGLSGPKLMFFIRDDLILLAVVGGLLVGLILLALIIYAIAAAAMHGTWRMCFQMDESAVALVRNPGTMKAVNALGTVSVAAGLLAGRPGEALRVGGTMAMVNQNGASRFGSARRVRILPKYDLLEMREWFGMNQIFVNSEDYGFVRDFILSHISEKARRRSGQ